MRKLLIFAAALGTIGATALPAAPAQAQYWGSGYYGGHYDRRWRRDARRDYREYRRDVRRASRECRRDLRRADSRWEYRRELRDCRRDFRDARRDYRRDRRWGRW